MVGVAIILAAFMTYASEQLAVRWFMRGLEDRGEASRSKSLCFMCWHNQKQDTWENVLPLTIVTLQ